VALLPGTGLLADAAAALAWARATLQPGDVLLVKGSNGVGLGRVVAGLQQEQAA
jgi:UDP-N-acetylmuramoyl-tripeptide--D-alanyl-D-alanine ligase